MAEPIESAERKIRPELNLEKWTIWQPSQSRRKPEPRIIEREIRLPDGSQRKARVEVGYTHKGALTTLDQKVFYSLIKIWEDKGKSITYTHVSLKKLADTLKMKWGTGAIETLTTSIDRLLITPFLWEYSYIDGETKELVNEKESSFTILSERKIITRKKDGRVTREEGYFRFHPLIAKNLLANYTKPLLFNVVISFRSEIAQLIYTQIDLFLADKHRYERASLKLFKDLGLEGSAYKYASKRKQMLEPALEELLGKPLSRGGVIGKASLERTKDGKDYKAVFERLAHLKTNKQEKETPEPLFENIHQDEENLIAGLRSFGVSEAKAQNLIKTSREAVETWIRAFPYVDPKPARNAAGWLVKAIQEGYELPQGYLDHLKEKDARRAAKEREKENAKNRRKEEAKREKLARGEEQFLAMPEDEREKLFSEYKDRLSQLPEWKNINRVGIGASLFKRAVQAAIVEDLVKGNQEE